MRTLMAAALACIALQATPARAQSSAPHAWLYGSWSGGLFPPPPGLSASLACLTQPVVIFTRDVVLRASLAQTTYTQRVIATARTAGDHTDFEFAPPEAATAAGLVGATVPPPTGFGCDNPNVLNVQRRSATEISFPGCADFPYPLVRCAAR